MSFILDALKKSETERQQQSQAEFSSVPASVAGPRAPRWLWVLAGLLAVNVIAMLWLVLGPTSSAPQGTLAPTERPASATVAESSSVSTFEQRVADAKSRNAAASPTATAPNPAPVQQQPAPKLPEPMPVVVDGLPTLTELLVSGEIQLPELHLDIHVFSDVPSDRFVFINMNKHREGSSLGEGPTVAEITADGVVLEYQGRRFKLPRE